MKKRRLSLLKSFPIIGCLTCILYILVSIVGLLVNGLVYKTGLSTNTLISTAINIIFYLSIAYIFYNQRNKSGMTYAMLVLAIATYLVPLIMVLIETFSITMFLIYLISTILGVTYSIILIINTRKPKKGLRITLLVFGILILISSLYSNIFMISGYIDSIIYYELSISEIFTYIISIIELIISLGFALLYFLYPLYLKEDSKY